MAILLGRPQTQGLSAPLSTVSDAPTIVVQVPEDACWPCSIGVDNIHATATVYLKWVRIDQSGRVSATDCSRRLLAGEGYVWENTAPRGAKLIAIASVADVQLTVDSNWSNIHDEGPVH